MEWLTTIKASIQYIEDNILTVKSAQEVADHVYFSSTYLERGFYVMTGTSIGEYIRNRRLYLASGDLIYNNLKVIDVAYKYGYETPESFTKAFTRFHGVSPIQAKKDPRSIKVYLPLQINIVITGGNNMDYSVKTIKAFKVIGFVKEFSSETAYKEIPLFWDEIMHKYAKNLIEGKPLQNKLEEAVRDFHIGEFGICLDDANDGKFKYMIAGKYEGGEIPQGLVVEEIKEKQWAIFECRGPLPGALQSVNTKIWKEWLPGNDKYELDGNYDIEWYSPNGNTSDRDYQSQIWIPVKEK